MSVGLTIPAMIALNPGFDQARSAGRRQRVPIVARVPEQVERNFDRFVRLRQPFRNGLANHLPQHVLVHDSSL